MEYQVVYTGSLEELVEIVNGYIAKGWEPQGGICSESTNVYFYQAMIRRN